MKLCCAPWRSVQGSAFHNSTGSFARFFVHLFCSRCWCSVLAVVGLCAGVLVLCACGWGGGEGTSPSRLITANERTPWRSILASAICNTHYHAAHTLL